MNQHLMNAMDATAKADAILYAIDETFMEVADSRLQHLFKTAWDMIQDISAELDKAAEDRKVVDAIYAVNLRAAR